MSMNIVENPETGQLRLLSILYYILAAIEALGACLVMGFALLGVAVMAGAIEGLPAEIAFFLGAILVAIELVAAVLMWVWCFLELLAARSLACRTRYRFCFVWACLELINFPFGTMVGIYTMVVLSLPNVRSAFDDTDQRERRLAALDNLDDDDEAPPRASTGDGAIQERPPNP